MTPPDDTTQQPTSSTSDPYVGLGYSLLHIAAPPALRASGVVPHSSRSLDGRDVRLLLYSAFRATAHVSSDQVEAALITPDATIVIEPVPGTGREQAEELVERLMSTARGLLPVRYLDWLAARAAMPTQEALHEAPNVQTLEEVLELLRERFGTVMSEPVVSHHPDNMDLIETRLYDTFDLSTGLECPRGNFFRSIAMPENTYLHGFPGERIGLGTTPASIRRDYDVLDQYCRARLDLPARP